MVGRVVRDIRRQAPGFDVLVVDDGSTDGTAAEAEAAGATVLRHPFNLGHRRRDAVRLQVRAAQRLRRRRPGRRRRPAQARLPRRDGRRAADRRRRPTWSTAAASAATPATRCRSGRRIGNLIFSVVLTAITRQQITDPTSGLPDDEPPRDRAVRARLPARLPRGRGDPDAARPPPAHPRGAGADERPRLRAQLDRLPAQRLLHGEGPAGAVRRPVPAPAAPPIDEPPTGPRASRSRPAPPSRAPRTQRGTP